MRVVVLGGAGNFGARIVRALQEDSDLDLVACSRRGITVPGAESVPVASLDIESAHFDSRLRSLSPAIVVHTVGPFQGQDYRVARAALACGAHYLDLADGRAFVAEFHRTLDEPAKRAGLTAISGASTLPALSGAVVEALVKDAVSPESIEVAIAPGQRAPRGAATLAAVFSYLGRPVRVWEDGRWRQRTGWMELRRIPLAFGTRWGALCDVPDLTLFPARYPMLRTARFHAALEFGVQHFMLAALAGLIRLGLPLPVARWCGPLERMAGWFDFMGGDWGGMRVSVVGSGANGQRRRYTWLLTAPAQYGPEIPCMAALCLVRRLASSRAIEPGARPCMGLLALDEFQPHFAQWGIRTEFREEPA